MAGKGTPGEKEALPQLGGDGDEHTHLSSRAGVGGDGVADFHEARLVECMAAVFADKSGAGERCAVHTYGEVGPVHEIVAGLDFERDAGAVERAGEEDAQARRS